LHIRTALFITHKASRKRGVAHRRRAYHRTLSHQCIPRTLLHPMCGRHPKLNIPPIFGRVRSIKTTQPHGSPWSPPLAAHRAAFLCPPKGQLCIRQNGHTAPCCRPNWSCTRNVDVNSELDGRSGPTCEYGEEERGSPEIRAGDAGSRPRAAGRGARANANARMRVHVGAPLEIV
jgi:hypothetical protein